MQNNKKFRSIRLKLVFILSLSALIAIVLSSAVLFWYTYNQNKNNGLKVLSQTVSIMGENLSASLEFDDSESAKSILSALKLNPDIEAGYILKDKNTAFAFYLKDGVDENEISKTISSLYDKNDIKTTIKFHDFYNVIVSKPIYLQNDYLASFVIISNTNSIHTMLKTQFIMQLLTSIFILLIIVFLAFKLQNIFTLPIFSLKGAMDTIRENGNYDVTINFTSNDEFQALFDGFYKMIETIKAQKIKLENYTQTLNETIKLKTADIQEQKNELEILLITINKNVIFTRTDLNGKITQVSEAFTHISGYNQEELAGKSHNILRHPDTQKELFIELWKTIKLGQIWRGEVKNLRKDGNYYWADIVVSPQYNAKHELIGYSSISQDITAQKEVQALSGNLENLVNERTKDLQEQQQQFASMVSNVPGAIYRVKDDSAWPIIYMSDEIETITGYPASDFMESKIVTFSTIMYPDDIEPIGKIIQKQFSQGKNFQVDYRVIRKNGEITWVRSQGQSIKSSSGDEAWIDGVLIDITEQKKMEESIKENRLFLNALLDSQEQIIITTNDISILSVNEAFLDFFAVDSIADFQKEYNAQCICDTFNTNAPEDYLQITIDGRSWIDYVISRKYSTANKAMITRGNKDFIFSVTAAKLPGKNGLKAAIFTNITEIEKAKQDVEQILANILLPVLITSKKERKILYANKYAEIQYEKTVDEIIGSDIDSIYTVQGQHYHIVDAIKKYGRVENMEENFKTSKGKEFTALLSVTPIGYQGVDAYIGMVADITKQKNMENEIRAIHKHTRESIEYAALIQSALIPDNKIFEHFFQDYFTIWNPKDIVGGDIYLMHELNENELILMIIDCTGHGVPGAFVTMLVKAIERQLMANIHKDETISPAKILSIFNRSIKNLLKQENIDSVSNAGFDGGIIYYNKKEKILKFSGAETALFYVDENNQLQTLKGSRHSVGYKKSDANFEFKEHIIHVENGMKFYCSTDGYLDQNGGEKGFPFGKKKFNEIIEGHYYKPMPEQREVFLHKMSEYENMIKNNDRNDDMTVIGFEI